MMFPGLLVIALVCHQALASHTLPKSFKRCARTDEHINECLKDAVTDALPKLKHGLPDLGIPNMDPIQLQRMEMNKGQGSVALRVSFRNMTIENFFDDIHIQRVRADLEKYTLELSLLAKILVSKGVYEVKGRVMVFPVNGHGRFSTTMYEPLVSLKIIGKPIMHKDGLIYMNIETVEVTQKPKKIVMNFENVINGEKRLSDNFNRFINENWKLVFDEISPNLFKSLGDAIKSHFTTFFGQVPFSEIFPDAQVLADSNASHVNATTSAK